jgi:hypothetical protein
MSNDLQRVVKLIEEHKEGEAREILLEALKTDSANDEAWVLLASITADRDERQKYLEEAVKHNPRNQIAQRTLQKMKGPVEVKAGIQPAQKLSTLEHVLCGWPLILVFFGGAIGGALGGIAYAINVAIYRANMPGPLKIVLNPVVGFLAIGLWLAIAVAITR